jgi:uncharacterized metal-binding protein YceD (DUF177 family)
VTKASFTVPVADLERGPRTVTFTLDEAWLHEALEGTDATPRRPASATVELSKSGRDVMVRGRVEAALSMPCVVTLDPIDIDLNPEIFLMLAPASASSEAKSPSTRGAKKRAAEGAERKGGAAQGSAGPRGGAQRKRGGDEELEEGELLDATAAARDTFEGSQIELDPFFREFLLLELPMFPRRSDLPLTEGPAIGAPPPEPGEHEPVIDPRLQPLAALRSRLRDSKE